MERVQPWGTDVVLLSHSENGSKFVRLIEKTALELGIALDRHFDMATTEITTSVFFLGSLY